MQNVPSAGTASSLVQRHSGLVSQDPVPFTSKPGPSDWAMAENPWPTLLHVCALTEPSSSDEKCMIKPNVNKARIPLQMLGGFQSQVGFLQVLAFASHALVIFRGCSLLAPRQPPEVRAQYVPKVWAIFRPSPVCRCRVRPTCGYGIPGVILDVAQVFLFQGHSSISLSHALWPLGF